jgi:hypothetical protein
MKTLNSVLTLMLVMLLAAPASFAQKMKKGPGMTPKADKIHARKVLHRTAVVILHAHKLVKQNKNYTGDLGKSIGHQRYAKKLFAQGKYQRAIHQSRLARLFAIKAIKANKGSDIDECKFTPEEQELMKNPPSEKELEDELIKNDPSNGKLKDQDNMLTEPDIDLNADE